MGLLKKENVRSDFTFVAEIVEAPEYVDETFTRNNPLPDQDKDFNVISLVWQYQQIHPEPREDGTKMMKFRASEGQREAIINRENPRMNPASVLGKLTVQCIDAGLPEPDEDDMQGQVVVVTRRSEVNRNGGTRLFHDIITSLGARDNADIDRGEELADKLNSDTKEVSSSY